MLCFSIYSFDSQRHLDWRNGRAYFIDMGSNCLHLFIHHHCHLLLCKTPTWLPTQRNFSGRLSQYMPSSIYFYLSSHFLFFSEPSGRKCLNLYLIKVLNSSLIWGSVWWLSKSNSYLCCYHDLCCVLFNWKWSMACLWMLDGG